MTEELEYKERLLLKKALRHLEKGKHHHEQAIKHLEQEEYHAEQVIRLLRELGIESDD